MTDQGHFGWQEHESAAWTTSAGGLRQGEPDFSHRCHVHRLAPNILAACWQWTVKAYSGGVDFRARGYTESMGEGKTACERAVRTLALGVPSRAYVTALEAKVTALQARVAELEGGKP